MRLLVPFAALLATACAGQQSAPRGAPELGVEFSWQGAQRCTDVSPRIAVTDVPPAARRLRVELVDIDSAFTRHGVNEIPVPPDGVIPAGGLKTYRGPCPSQQSVVYEMRVAALDEGGRVLAQGSHRETYTPLNLRRPSRSGQR